MCLAWDGSDAITDVMNALAREMRRDSSLVAITESVMMSKDRKTISMPPPDTTLLDEEQRAEFAAHFPSLPLLPRSVNMLRLARVPLLVTDEQQWQPDMRGEQVYNFWDDGTRPSIASLVDLLGSEADDDSDRNVSLLDRTMPSVHGVLGRPDDSSMTPLYGFLFGSWVVNRQLWSDKNRITAWRISHAKRPRVGDIQRSDWLFSTFLFPHNTLPGRAHMTKAAPRVRSRDGDAHAAQQQQ